MAVESRRDLASCHGSIGRIARAHSWSYRSDNPICTRTMRRRDAGVEADAREWADLAFGVAKNPIARVSILARVSGPSRGRFRHGHNLYLLAMTVAVVPEAQAPKNGRFIAAEAVPGVTPGRSHNGPLE